MTTLKIINLACIVGNVGVSIYLAKRKNWIAFTGWALASYLSVALYGVRTWD